MERNSSLTLNNGGTRMDAFYNEILEGRVATGMAALASHLYHRRAELSKDAWKAYVASEVLSHPIRDLIHRDPFTFRSFSKPRGYAGDAVMIDMIYGNAQVPLGDRTANALFSYTTGRPAPRAVKDRRQRIALLIDEAIRQRSNARILALAAGHLRELDVTESTDRNFTGEIVALDQDEESLSVIGRDYGQRGVRLLHASIKRLLTGRLELHGFDLVYAAGLLDYLSQPVAKALCREMFEMLNPGGKMVVANFFAGIPDVGYMESFMDWHLIYRSGADMRDLIDGIPSEQIGSANQTLEETKNISYLTISKR